MNRTKRLISFINHDLSCFDELHLGFLLLEATTGIEYENQVGGHSCHQTKIEGFAIPVSAKFAELRKYFTDSKYGGWCSSGIDSDDADFIDHFLKSSDIEIEVDHTRLNKAMEAWIPIISGSEKGFLTWSNSD